MTLFTFQPDNNGYSACNGECATIWPLLLAGANAVGSGNWSLITRDDGQEQWSCNGMPLYTFIQDMMKGVATGDGFHGAWHIAQPRTFFPSQPGGAMP